MEQLVFVAILVFGCGCAGGFLGSFVAELLKHYFKSK